MLQQNRYSFARDLQNGNGNYWRFFAFDGDIPRCIEDIPFDIESKPNILYEKALGSTVMISRAGPSLKLDYVHSETAYQGRGHSKQGDLYRYRAKYRHEGPHSIESSLFSQLGKSIESWSDYSELFSSVIPLQSPYINNHFFFLDYDEEVTVTHASMSFSGTHQYTPRRMKIEYWDDQIRDWVHGAIVTSYSQTGFNSAREIGTELTASKFRLSFTQGYSSYQALLLGLSLLGSQPSKLAPVAPTWGVLAPIAPNSTIARTTTKFPFILVGVNTPNNGAEGIKLFKDTFGPGDMFIPGGFEIEAEISETVIADSIDPVIQVPSSKILGATSPVGLEDTDMDMVDFLDSVYATDNYDCYLPLSNDLPATLPIGDTLVTFTATDKAGNVGTGTCLITVADLEGPVITILGNVEDTAEGGAVYTDQGASALDNIDGDLTGNITVVNNVDTNTLGIYSIEYTCVDAAGNSTTAVRNVTIQDTNAPTITTPANLFVDAEDSTGTPAVVSAIATFLNSATATDDVDQSLTVTNNAPDILPLGESVITFECIDDSGNKGIANSKITVVDNTAPVITVIGNTSIVIAHASTYTDQGASAFDAVDGDISGSIVASGIVDTNVIGDHVITYNVIDSAGNEATTHTRTVTVEDQEKPILTLLGDSIVNSMQGDVYTDQGASAFDVVDGDISGSIVVVNPVDINTPGTYTVTYNVSDAAGNIAVEIIRSVNVTGV